MSAAKEVTVSLPDGSKRQYPAGTSFGDVALSIGPGLARAALGAIVDGDDGKEDLKDMMQPLERDTKLKFVTAKDPKSVEIVRHTAAHVLAMAVQKLWPGTQVTIGPVIEAGFFYDFAFPEGVKINEGDFEKIEAEMAAIIKADVPLKRDLVSRADAISTFKGLKEAFKVEIIQDLPESAPISLYKMGDWFDLCRGPHVPSTGKIGAIKLTSVAGAYWRGDEKNPMLTRIYGVAFNNKKELEEHMTKLEEARKRDHRVLGKQLGLFSFHKEAPANAFFHPNGAFLYQSLMSFMRKSNREFNYEEVNTPLMMNVELWHKSGHYENYRENMYFTKVDDTDAAIKPMNCPGHCLVYATTRHSYRELPLRLSEFGRVHRHERSGVTHGLFRVRTFVQDDAHIFCTPEQIGDEIAQVLKQIDGVYSALGFGRYRMELSTRPAKSIGSDEMWAAAEEALKKALDASGKEYRLNPGDGAFYGPKIDFHLIDAIDRSWQCGTVQLDFSMPGRFDLEYQGGDDKAHTPVMIHRAVLGSLERFLGIFIEHYAGHFPLWIAPTQVRVINVAKDQEEYAKGVVKAMKDAGMRAEGDHRNETLNYRIRDAQLAKIPYMIVIGDKEKQAGTVSARHHDGQQLPAQATADFINFVRNDCGAQWGLN